MVLFRWRPAYAGVFLLQILLITDLTIVGLAKKGGGGGAGRGAKGGSMSRPSSSGGNTGRVGGSHSQPTYNRPSSSGGVYSAGSYGNKKPSGTSLGGGSWKTHAAAGVAGAVIGAAVSHKLTKSYYKHHYGGRDYYYGDRYYHPSSQYARKCTYAVNEDLQYDDGQRVTHLVFECGRYEHCCGDTCCSNRSGMPWWGILLSVLAVICLLASCVYLVMRFRKNRPATQYSGTAQTDASVPLQANTDDMSAAKAYTAQPGFYAGAPTYPAYPPAPGAGTWQGQPPPYGYPPPAAPGYGFNVQQPGPYPRQY